MARYQFLLLDAGPIIKLFEMGKWDEFVNRCDVTVARTVAENEVVYCYDGDAKDFIDFKRYEEEGLVNIVDAGLSAAEAFHSRFDERYKTIIHAGEKETLAFLYGSDEDWRLCAADGAVFRVLGLLGRGDQGVSLEEVLQATGLPCSLEYQFTKRFREKHTRHGEADSIQGMGIA